MFDGIFRIKSINSMTAGLKALSAKSIIRAIRDKSSSGRIRKLMLFNAAEHVNAGVDFRSCRISFDWHMNNNQ